MTRPDDRSVALAMAEVRRAMGKSTYRWLGEGGFTDGLGFVTAQSRLNGLRSLHSQLVGAVNREEGAKAVNLAEMMIATVNSIFAPAVAQYLCSNLLCVKQHFAA